MDVDLELLHELIRTLESSNLSELEVKVGDAKIRLRRYAHGQPQVVAPAPVASAATAPAEPGRAAAAPQSDGEYVTSPFVGTFYRAPTPDSDPFVREGDVIEPGQTLCIVEAMKLMNEIEAEVHGRVVEILAENGKPVEYGDRLFRIKPD